MDEFAKIISTNYELHKIWDDHFYLLANVQ